MIKYAYTILYVQDVSRSIAFYENAFQFKKRFIAPNNDYGELSTGDTILSFATTELAGTNLQHGFIESNLSAKPFGIEIAFATENVEQAYEAALRAGGTAESPAKIKPHGQTVAYIRDPDGFLVEICTPMI